MSANENEKVKFKENDKVIKIFTRGKNIYFIIIR